MRGRLVLAGLGLVAGLSPVSAQIPPASPPLPPQFPRPAEPSRPAHLPAPRGLPPSMLQPQPLAPPATPQPNALAPTLPGLPDGSAVPLRIDAPLPYPEQKVPLDAGSVIVKRVNASWQVWANQRPLKDVGPDDATAQKVARALRDLRPTEWAAIGGPRPVVEYGLIDGRPAVGQTFPDAVVPIDLGAVRVDALRGVWVVRDDDAIHFNFGLNRADAEQAVAVIRKYGFNRVGVVGPAGKPALLYLFAALEQEKAPRPAGGALVAAAQEAAMTRTGIPVPGVGYVGEKVTIDPRSAEARRDGAEWVVAAGPEVLARFGPHEWAARDAARLVKEAHFTEFCRVGGAAGLTFFLSNGRPPTRVPLSAQGRRFNPNELKAHQSNGRWAVTEAGRHLFDVGGPEEGEAVVRLLKHFGFDQVCQVGPTPKVGLQFLARSR